MLWFCLENCTLLANEMMHLAHYAIFKVLWFDTLSNRTDSSVCYRMDHIWTASTKKHFPSLATRPQWIKRSWISFNLSLAQFHRSLQSFPFQHLSIRLLQISELRYFEFGSVACDRVVRLRTLTFRIWSACKLSHLSMATLTVLLFPLAIASEHSFIKNIEVDRIHCVKRSQ